MKSWLQIINPLSWEKNETLANSCELSNSSCANVIAPVFVVWVTPGRPITCVCLCSDPAMKQFLLYLDESNALGKKFIIQDIDDTHVFVIAELVNVLQERVGELMDQNAFSLTQKWKCQMLSTWELQTTDVKEAHSMSHTIFRLFMSILWGRLQAHLFRWKPPTDFVGPLKQCF